jgi:hypothetical protein
MIGVHDVTPSEEGHLLLVQNGPPTLSKRGDLR